MRFVGLTRVFIDCDLRQIVGLLSPLNYHLAVKLFFCFGFIRHVFLSPLCFITRTLFLQFSLDLENFRVSPKLDADKQADALPRCGRKNNYESFHRRVDP